MFKVSEFKKYPVTDKQFNRVPFNYIMAICQGFDDYHL